jgi:hypothetical protein
MGFRWILCGTAGLTLAGACWALQGHDFSPDFPVISLDHESIEYAETADDPIAGLQHRLDTGELRLDFEPQWGYLRSVLKHLGIAIDSQVLVFSQTSSQISEISPATPRAIYFNDDAFVAHVQNGSVLELAALDSERGMIFYTLDVKQSDRPRFSRQEMNCLQCHMTPATLNVPSIVVGSAYAADYESPFVRPGSFATDHRIRLQERWGGWYVTGRHGSLRHRGNIPLHLSERPSESELQTQNVISLADRLKTDAYLTSTSDIVALMTLEHQTRMTSLITRIGWETRIAEAEEGFQSRLDSLVGNLLTYMLFLDEASFPAPIEGVSTFATTFSERGPRDRMGRSLRDFDLQRRLFRYPLSYMVYSNAFDRLPAVAQAHIYRKLYDVLTGKDTSQRIAHISEQDRRAVLEILRDTKPNLPAYWDAPDSVP